MRVILVLCVIIGLIAFVTYDINVNEPQRRQQERAEAKVLVDGRACEVHVLVDKDQHLQWRFIYIDRGALILPGSERPWHPPVEQVER